jgi:hypothetical protein
MYVFLNTSFEVFSIAAVLCCCNISIDSSTNIIQTKMHILIACGVDLDILH